MPIFRKSPPRFIGGRQPYAPEVQFIPETVVLTSVAARGSAASRGAIAPASLSVSSAASARATARGSVVQSSIAIPVAASALAVPRGALTRSSIAVSVGAVSRAAAFASCGQVAIATPSGLYGRAAARGRVTPLTSTGAPAHAWGRATSRAQVNFSSGVGAGVRAGWGRAAPQGVAQVQWFVGAIPIRPSTFGVAGVAKGRITPSTIVASSQRGRAVSLSSADGAGLADPSLRNASGRAVPRGRVTPQIIATAMRASGRANPRGRTSLVAAVSTSGRAMIRGRAGGTELVKPGLRGRAVPRGTVTRLFAGAFVARGFAKPRGRIAAAVRISVSARGRAAAQSLARSSLLAQQAVVQGAPPPLTIWQRLASVTPSHQLQEKPRVMRNTFGDGYGQTVPDGLTPIVRTLTLSWENLDRSEADQIVQFLKDSIGQPISFAAPRERSPRNWIAMDWRRTSPQPNADNLTVTFEDRPFRELILGL